METLGFKKPKLGLFNRGKFYEWFLYASESIVFRKNTVYERKEFRDRDLGAINYGHSSLAFKEDGVSIATNSKLSMERRKSLSTTICGNIIFPEHGNLVVGGGERLYWTNDSGQALLRNSESTKNRSQNTE